MYGGPKEWRPVAIRYNWFPAVFPSAVALPAVILWL